MRGSADEGHEGSGDGSGVENPALDDAGVSGVERESSMNLLRVA